MTTPQAGHYGPYGGRFVPEALMAALDELTAAFDEASDDPQFAARLDHLQRTYTGRPSPLTDATRLAEHAGDMRRCADWTADHLRAIGLQNVRAIDTPGHPVVYGDWLNAPGAPTVLFYGHYDVQPVDPLELWTSPPFEATVRDNELFARGATDDKGQLFVHVKALEAHLDGLDRHQPHRSAHRGRAEGHHIGRVGTAMHDAARV